MNVQSFLKNDEFDDKSTVDLIEIVNNDLLLERARAIYSLAKRCKNDDNLILQITEKIFDPKNKKAKLLGMVTVSFLGIGGLVEADTTQTKKVVNSFIKTLSKNEYEELLFPP
jgi:hypothetical protein